MEDSEAPAAVALEFGDELFRAEHTILRFRFHEGDDSTKRATRQQILATQMWFSYIPLYMANSQSRAGENVIRLPLPVYTSSAKRKPGSKGPAPELIQAICELKRRNPRFGCPKIALHLAKAFGIDLDKDRVRRVLAAHYRPQRRESGPSWLTFLGHAKDSLWSVDLFRTESILLKTHWILVVMDQFTRRLVGFGVEAVAVDGLALCRMFNQVIAGRSLPVRLSFDHDPLFQFRRWQANLRVLGVEAVQTVPHVPWSHPFVERLVGTIRREYLDHSGLSRRPIRSLVRRAEVWQRNAR